MPVPRPIQQIVNFYVDVEGSDLNDPKSKNSRCLMVVVICAILFSLVSLCITVALNLTQSKDKYPLVSSQEHYSRDDFDFLSVSAHKYLVSPNRRDDKRTLLIRYPSNDDKNEHAKGVELTDTGLKVKYPGLYYVYKSVYFVPNTDSNCQELATMVFNSTLRRTNLPKVQNLLTSSYTCCPDCALTRDSAFTGGIFELKKGDEVEIFLNMDADKIVHFSKTVTYFGLWMMNSQHGHIPDEK